MIAFSSFVEDPQTGQGDWDLFVVDLLTERVVNVTPYAGDQSSPSWSPDGSAIAFVEDNKLLLLNAGNATVDVVVDDSGIQLTSESRPTWSPDGAYLSVPGVREGRGWSIDYDLFRVRPSGGDLVNLTNTSRRREIEAEWNPAWMSM